MTGRGRGAVYCAVGRNYIDKCVDSARSLRYHNPTFGVVLYADDIEYALEKYGDVFTAVEPIAYDDKHAAWLDWLRSSGKLPSLKVLICHRSPFDETLSIDGDTLILGDLSDAFDKLEVYDILACEECRNSLSFIDNRWIPTGLIDTRRNGYINAGVLFYNSKKQSVLEFVAAWRDNLISMNSTIPIELRGNDQDVLNYMFWYPGQFCQDITLSTDALRAERYNCYCRMWMEVWESGQWENVKIIHSWMTPTIQTSINSESFTWSSIFSETFNHFSYIVQFRIGGGGISQHYKRELYSADPRSITSLLCKINLALKLRLHTGIISRIDAISIELSAGYSLFERINPCTDLLHRWYSSYKGGPLTVLKIGISHSFAGIGQRNISESFRRGYDLEFFASVFSCRNVICLIRFPFLAYTSERIYTRYVPYDTGIVFEDNELPIALDLLVDDDVDVSLDKRVMNFAGFAERLSVCGVGLFLVPSEQDEEALILLKERLKTGRPSSLVEIFRSDRLGGGGLGTSSIIVTDQRSEQTP